MGALERRFGKQNAVVGNNADRNSADMREPGQERLWVRIYDLDDPRSSNIRSVVGPIPAGKQPYLLSVRP